MTSAAICCLLFVCQAVETKRSFLIFLVCVWYYPSKTNIKVNYLKLCVVRGSGVMKPVRERNASVAAI